MVSTDEGAFFASGVGRLDRVQPLVSPTDSRTIQSVFIKPSWRIARAAATVKSVLIVIAEGGVWTYAEVEFGVVKGLFLVERSGLID